MWVGAGVVWAATLGVAPLTPTVETRPAAHIAPIVRQRSRRGVSQVKLWV
jgi:hypothetical protein